MIPACCIIVSLSLAGFTESLIVELELFHYLLSPKVWLKMFNLSLQWNLFLSKYSQHMYAFPVRLADDDADWMPSARDSDIYL